MWPTQVGQPETWEKEAYRGYGGDRRGPGDGGGDARFARVMNIDQVPLFCCWEEMRDLLE
jgi:hypothetical protein